MRRFLFFLLVAGLSVTACNKAEFLAQKPELSLEVPGELSDYRAILDNDGLLNGGNAEGCTPQLAETGSDNYYLLDKRFVSNLRSQMQNYYIWKASPYSGVPVLDWSYPYRNILMANVVLDGLATRSDQGEDEVKVLKGEALFHRAHMFFQLASVFCPIYYKGNNGTARGIPLRLTANINEALSYASLSETFAQIESELKESAQLLPSLPAIKTRPSKAAAFALLSRLYLYEGDYEQALLYADSCLLLYDTLLDFNTLDPAGRYGFTMGSNQHPEVIFASNMLSGISQAYPIRIDYARVDSMLFASYDDGDLRKVLFFRAVDPGYQFKGSYTGNTAYFAGLATDEVYLNKAEACFRLGELEAGYEVLNALLKTRWDKKTAYEEVVGSVQGDAIDLIMHERQKELLFRGIRWLDLKRLIAEGETIELKRVVAGMTVTLNGSDDRWVWPVPPEVEEFMD